VGKCLFFWLVGVCGCLLCGVCGGGGGLVGEVGCVSDKCYRLKCENLKSEMIISLFV